MKVLFSYESKDDLGSVCRIEQTYKGFDLVYEDFLAEQWRESFQSLAVALLRFAVLVDMCEKNEQNFFALDIDEFAKVGQNWITSQLAN